MYTSKTEAVVFGIIGGIMAAGAAWYFGKKSAEKAVETTTSYVTDEVAIDTTEKALKE